MENERAGVGRDDRTRLARPNSLAQTGTAKHASLFRCPKAGLETIPVDALFAERDDDTSGMCFAFSKKNLNASRPSEHPPVRGRNVKTFRWYLIVLLFLSFFFVFVFMLLLELWRCSSDIFLFSRPRNGLATTYRRYFQHAHFTSIVGVGKRGAY